MIINLTPHPIKLYPSDTPDRIDPGDYEPEPELVLPATDPPARIGETGLGPSPMEGCPVPVATVKYGTVAGLPPFVRDDPPTWYVVSLAVALVAQRKSPRSDLLVPHREVRNFDGTVVGCRELAQVMG